MKTYTRTFVSCAVFALALLASQPAQAYKIFFVGSGDTPGAEDANLINRMRNTLLFEVQFVNAANAATNKFGEQGGTLIWISASINSGQASTTLLMNNLNVPIVCCENWAWDNLKLTTSGTGEDDDDGGTGVTQIDIVDSAHPLAASLPSGLQTIATTPIITVFAVPALCASAHVVARVTATAPAVAGNTYPCLFYIEPGAVLADNVTVAGARMVGWFLRQNGGNFGKLDANGLALFDKAVLWAQGLTTVPTPPSVTITNPVTGQTFASGANVTLESAVVQGDGGAIASVQYFANGISLGLSSNAPFSLTWSNVAAGYYNLSARVVDAGNLSRVTSDLLSDQGWRSGRSDHHGRGEHHPDRGRPGHLQSAQRVWLLRERGG